MDYGLSDKNMMAKDDIFIYKNNKQEATAKDVGWDPKDENEGGRLRCQRIKMVTW